MIGFLHRLRGGFASCGMGSFPVSVAKARLRSPITGSNRPAYYLRHSVSHTRASLDMAKPDGSLDMDRLLREFQKFWQRHSEIWEQKSNYTEAFPHLLLMAFLQRILNGGGHIEREYAAGRGRMDLAVEYNKQLYIIEIKLIRYYDTFDYVKEEGLEQIRAYRDRTDFSAPAYLVIFDRRPEAKQKAWSERLKWLDDGDVTVVEC